MHSDTLILGVDLDGVCADYTTAFRPLVAQELNVPLSSLPGANVTGLDENEKVLVET